MKLSSLLFIVLAAVAGWSTNLVAQESPRLRAAATIGGTALSVSYSAPSVRGRKIFGDDGLVSKDRTYPAWRAGANAATTLQVDGDLTIGGLRVPKGTYTLFVWVRDPKSWELIVNKQTGQWGLTYNAAQDLGRVKMTMQTPPALVETLAYTIKDKGNGVGELTLAWEHHVATVPVTTK